MEIHIKCLTQACENLNKQYQYLDTDKNLIRVDMGNTLFFQSNRTPFNTEVTASICRDKEHSYRLLHKQIAMPKTIGFLDVNIGDQYRNYVRYNSKSSIINKIEKEFNYPVVVKRNSGALGINVFLCPDRKMVSTALDQIFNRNNSNYDYVALAQEYIQAKKEFRVVFFRGELLLCYQRVSENDKFGARYWDTNMGHAIHINCSEELSALSKFVDPALKLPGLNYVGFDIIKNNQDDYILIEMNSGPKYNNYVKSNGTKKIIAMYEKILTKESKLRNA